MSKMAERVFSASQPWLVSSTGANSNGIWPHRKTGSAKAGEERIAVSCKAVIELLFAPRATSHHYKDSHATPRTYAFGKGGRCLFQQE
jgi:hypothetical protein